SGLTGRKVTNLRRRHRLLTARDCNIQAGSIAASPLHQALTMLSTLILSGTDHVWNIYQKAAEGSRYARYDDTERDRLQIGAQRARHFYRAGDGAFRRRIRIANQWHISEMTHAHGFSPGRSVRAWRHVEPICVE